MAILSAGVEIVYKNPNENEIDLVERYRAKSSNLSKLEDLLKYQIDIIVKKYGFENIISIKFTG